MDGNYWLGLLVQLIGIAMVLLSLVDVFMTVLYARVGTGPLSHRLATYAWPVVRRATRPLPHRTRYTLLSFFGPGYLVSLITIWIALLLLGFTLFTWPELGRGVANTSGTTPTDFWTAFYYAGGSLTTVGNTPLQPASRLFKFINVIDSALGISVMTLALSYVIQIYTALHGRNALVLGLHHASGSTGDAAALLAGMGPGDDFSRAGSTVANLAASATSVYEAHHFYSVLMYFRFSAPYYAMGRGSLLTMEMITLIDTALDENKHGWLAHSAPITQLRQSGNHLMSELARVYLPCKPEEAASADRDITDRWRLRYFAAIEHLRHCGISVTHDPQRNVERYVALRREWDRYVMAFAHYMAYSTEEIDPASADLNHAGRSHRESDTLLPGAA